MEPGGAVGRVIVRPGRVLPLSATAIHAPASPLENPLQTPGRHHAEPLPPLIAPPPPRRFRPRARWLVLAGMVAAAAVVAPISLLWMMNSQPAGTMVFPASRGYSCRAGGKPHDTSPACKAAAAVRPIDGSDQGLGDGTAVEIPDVGKRHNQVIPDSRLCSAGRERFRGLDLARDDWPATALPSGGVTTLKYQLAGDYRGTLHFYLTLKEYDPTDPLDWSDLTEFAATSGAPDRTGMYQVKVRLPVRSGRQLLYTIWEQSGGTAALYSCSDVVFGGTAGTAGNGPTGPKATLSPSASTTATVAPASARPTPGAATSAAAPTWAPGVSYDVGDVVLFRGLSYRCVQPHRSIYGWEPTAATALWEPLN